MDVAAEPKHWTILVGVNFYRYPGPSLEGCVRDVRDIEQYLNSRQILGHVKTFTASRPSDSGSRHPEEEASLWPTYENFTASIKRITSEAQPGDFVYIHYSGHGTQVLASSSKSSHDTTGDLALVLFDDANGVRYLHGIELAFLIDQMVRRQMFVTLVLDCCFAGSVVRHGNCERAVIRAIDYDPLIDAAYPVSTDLRALYLTRSTPHRDAHAFPTWMIDPAGYTIFSACGPHEIAQELILSNYNKSGALSHFLLRALKSCAGTEITTKSLYHHLRMKFHVYWPEQTPMYYGRKDLSLFGKMPSEVTTNLVAVLKIEKNRLLLDAGLAHCVCKGDEYAMYPFAPPEDGVNSATETLFHARVEEVRDLTSDLVGVKATSTILPKDTRLNAKPLTHLYPWNVPVRLEIGDRTHAPWIEFANEKRFIELTIGEKEGRPSLFTVSVTEDDEYQFLDSSHSRITSLPRVPCKNPKAIGQVVSLLEHLATFKKVEGIENRIPKLSFEQLFTIHLEDESGKKNDAGGMLVVKHKSMVKLVVENSGNCPLYLSILDLQPTWQIYEVLAASGGEGFKVVTPKKEADDRPEHFGKQIVPIVMTIPESLRDLGLNQCEDVFKVFITSKASQFGALCLPEIPTSANKLEGPNRGEYQYNQLSDLLSVLARPVRGAPAGRPDENWATMNFTVRTIFRGSDGS